MYNTKIKYKLYIVYLIFKLRANRGSATGITHTKKHSTYIIEVIYRCRELKHKARK